MKKLFTLVLTVICFLSCQTSDSFDMIILADQIQTVDQNMRSVQAIGIKDGRISALGSKGEVLKDKGEHTKVLDLGKAWVMPGFIEGHGHFSGLGKSVMNLNFLKSKSWQEIVAMVGERSKTAKAGEWIYGRGWHQDKWDQAPDDAFEFYPRHDGLSEVSQDNPVILFHASGHSLFANEKAMELAGINPETPDPKGGHIVRDASGRAIGVFEERAMGPIRQAYEDYLKTLDESALEAIWYESIEKGMDECLSKGITSFQDAGTYFDESPRYQQMAKDGKLRLRLWSMIRHSYQELKGNLSPHRVIGLGDGFYTCRAIKSEVDGALGSYGAWLLKSYDDKSNFVGQNTTDIEEVERLATLAKANDMQLCIHAIGDKANREVLDIIERHATGDHRWRIEHAQHLHPDDIPRFKKLGAIASMQGVHCTSDSPFVVTRLGQARAKMGAYVWKSLIESGAVVINGTDAPVEDVDPLASYYASVTRRRSDTGLEFFTEQKMTREEALRSYTIDAAYGAFEEDVKGSLEIGKYADLTILDHNLLTCSDEEILKTQVLYTIVDGKIQYSKD